MKTALGSIEGDDVKEEFNSSKFVVAIVSVLFVGVIASGTSILT